MKNSYYLLLILIVLTTATSCKVQYGAHFQRTNAPQYTSDKTNKVKSDEPETTIPADLLASRESETIPPALLESRPWIPGQPETNPKPGLSEKINRSIQKYSPPGMDLDVTKEPEKFLKDYRSLERAEQRKIKREIRKVVKKELKAYKNSDSKELSESPLATDNEVLLIILAILLPPLAVGLHEGELNGTFWLNLLLTLIFYLPGMIHALIVVTR